MLTGVDEGTPLLNTVTDKLASPPEGNVVVLAAMLERLKLATVGVTKVLVDPITVGMIVMVPAVLPGLPPPPPQAARTAESRATNSDLINMICVFIKRCTTTSDTALSEQQRGQKSFLA
jgi:hypothetical protein